MVGVDDLDALTFAGFMMNEHGMDPISFGVTLAAAMELYEKGIITKSWVVRQASAFPVVPGSDISCSKVSCLRWQAPRLLVA